MTPKRHEKKGARSKGALPLKPYARTTKKGNERKIKSVEKTIQRPFCIGRYLRNNGNYIITQRQPLGVVYQHERP